MKLPQLPSMRCDDNCGECCGIVMCSEQEYEHVIGYAVAHDIPAVDQGAACPFYQGGRCAVHPVRPFPCHMFGHVPKLECPHGYNVNITPKHEKRLNRKYHEELQDAVLLHAALTDIRLNSPGRPAQ